MATQEFVESDIVIGIQRRPGMEDSISAAREKMNFRETLRLPLISDPPVALSPSPVALCIEDYGLGVEGK